MGSSITPLPFSSPNPRSLPTFVNQPQEVVMASWQAQLTPLVSNVAPQATPLNFTVKNAPGGNSLSWSPVHTGDGYEILASVNGSFTDDLQVIPIKDPSQNTFFHSTNGTSQTVSYRVRTTSGTTTNPQSQRGPETGPIRSTSINPSDTSAVPYVRFDVSTTDSTRARARFGNYGALKSVGSGQTGGANVGTGGSTGSGGGTGGGTTPPPGTSVTSFTGDGLLYSNDNSTGNVTLQLIAQSANTVLAGPSTPTTSATPTFRALIDYDLPATNPTGSGYVISASSPSSFPGTANDVVTIDDNGNPADSGILVTNFIQQGVNTLTGGLTLQAGTATYPFLLQNTTAATSISNKSTMELELVSQYWSGSSSQGKWVLQGTYASGTNPAATLVLSYTGSSGGSSVSVPALTATSSITAGVNASTAGTLVLANGGALGTSITIQNLGNTTAYNFNLPIAAGSAGQVLTSQGGSSTSMTWTTPTVGTVTSVAESFTGGLISVAGSPITTSGTFALTVAGTSGGVPYFSSATTWASSAALASGQFVLGGGAGNPPTTTFSVVPVANGGTGTGSTLTGLVRGSASAFSAAEISGDATTSGSNALTLATVNTNVGFFTYASITVNGKGLVTAASSGAAPTTAWSSITNPAGNLALTMGADTTTFSYATALAAAWLWNNTTPTVTGASTTVALSTGTAPTNVGSVWTYTLLATETGAGSNAWVGASVTTSGWTGGATGNNGTFTITASTTTTVSWTNASGTATNTGIPVMISSAVSSSPVLQLAGTVNTGTAGTLNSAADTWSIQNVIGSVAPNPTSYLTFTHSGSTSASVGISVPSILVGTSSSPCSIAAPGSPTDGFQIGATQYVVSNGTAIIQFGRTTYESIVLGPSGGMGWSNTAANNVTNFTGLTMAWPGVVQVSNTTTVNNLGSLWSTGYFGGGGLTLQQYNVVPAAPTVTPTGGSATSYSYKITAYDINLQPIGSSAAGSTAAGVATLTTSAFNTITWVAVEGAWAYGVARTVGGATQGILNNSISLSGDGVTVSAGVSTIFTVASAAINAKLAGMLITVSGCANANNNGTFYCISSTATVITLANLSGVAETAPASATLTIAGVPAQTLSFIDYGWTSAGTSAPSTNTSGSLGFVAPYESATSGTALSQDLWSVYPSVASGLNGASTLTFAHTGSTGLASISAPNINAVTAFYAGGTIGVTQTAEAVGTIATIGGIVTTFTGVSDERLKIFTPSPYGLKEILAINPIRYRWNETGQKYSGQSTERDFIGFSAQNVQKTIPEAVHVSKDDYLGFDDRPVIAALVRAVQELEERLAKLEHR